MEIEKIERARQLLNVLELKESGDKVEKLMRLLCIQELSRREQVIEIKK